MKYGMGLVLGVGAIGLCTMAALSSSAGAARQDRAAARASGQGPAGGTNEPRTTVKWLEEEAEGGNALLSIDFGGEPPAGAITLNPEDGPVAMRPDAGQAGTFTATIRIDFEGLRATLQEVEKAAPADAPDVVFRGRQLVRAPAPDRLRADELRPGVEFDPRLLPAVPGLVDPERSLMIVHTDVVNDPARTFNLATGAGTPMGAWTFGHVMEVLCDQANTGIDPAVFTRRWLAQWETDQVVNGFVIPRRTGIKTLIIDPWEAASGGPGSPLDLSKAPFRLLAIVNRVDLRDNLLFEPPPATVVEGPGPPVVLRDSNSGEGRLIFGALDTRVAPPQPVLFTVIFEFGINKEDCHAQRDWARRWYDLKQHTLGTPAYNAALQEITDEFIKPSADPSARPRPNGLNQLRTNEIALAFEGGLRLWELREFRVAREDSDKGHLRSVTVKQTPDTNGLNGTPRLAQFANDHASAILNNAHTAPLLYPTFEAFLGASAPTPGGFFWDGPPPPPSGSIAVPGLRHALSLNTCNGCHAGETGTAFTFVKPEGTLGTQAALAGFLTGRDAAGNPFTVPDPAGEAGPPREFADLLRRQIDLFRLVNYPCELEEYGRRPLRMTH